MVNNNLKYYNIRWRVFHFRHQFDLEEQKAVLPCGYCFTKMLLDQLFSLFMLMFFFADDVISSAFKNGKRFSTTVYHLLFALNFMLLLEMCFIFMAAGVHDW